MYVHPIYQYAILSTVQPTPDDGTIPTAYKWASRYTPTPSPPLLDMSQGAPGVPPPIFYKQSWERHRPALGELALRKALTEEMGFYGPETDVSFEEQGVIWRLWLL